MESKEEIDLIFSCINRDIRSLYKRLQQLTFSDRYIKPLDDVIEELNYVIDLYNELEVNKQVPYDIDENQEKT